MRLVLPSIAVLALATAGAVAQQPQQSPQSGQSAPSAGSGWVPPGSPGSPIDGTFFHAQVLMSAHGFSPGVIDGKEGQSFKLALQSFQEARGLKRTGKLDPETRRALLSANRPATIMVRLGPDDLRHQYVYPFPDEPEQQAELKFLGYRNMLEKLAERYHTTPATIVALNGPDKMIGPGQTLRLPNVVPTARDYSGVPGNGASVMNVLNVDAKQPQGDYVVVDKSEGVLKVYRGSVPGEDGEGGERKARQLVAAFPVTMGSRQYPLPIGRWKATTYAFLPPFNYQPALLNNPKS
ncbi:MAG: peptidoglycan-binding protein, partial [Pseudomonadota bacterium]|nr:peptidoglycan-binding protein [Pseudomonadota bacterium]